MKVHLTQKYGKPTVYNSKDKFEKCAPKGILVLDVPGWSDASGHATLWDGKTTIDDAQKEYFGKPNVKFNLWKEEKENARLLFPILPIHFDGGYSFFMFNRGVLHANLQQMPLPERDSPT